MESLLCLGNLNKATLSSLCIPRRSQFPFLQSHTISRSTICHRPSQLSVNSLRCTVSPRNIPERGLSDVEKCKKTLQTTLKTSLVFLCAIGLVGASGFMKMTTPRAIACDISIEQVDNPCIASLKALKMLLEAGDYKVLSVLEFVAITICNDPTNCHERKLYEAAMDREGDEDIVATLKEIYEAEKKEQEKLNRLNEFELEMALVEVLVCLGEFEEALKCKCLNDPAQLADNYSMFNQQIHLYKAIASAMLTDDRVKWEHKKKGLQIN